MSVQVDKSYYFIVHAYHHVVARVTAVTGKREVDIENVVWVYSSSRDWTEFFLQGFQQGDNIKHFPNGHNVEFMASFEWNHPIPEAPRATKRQPRS